ncbi:TetR family transcriptional regulator [Murinocardiopsis flavida]|uniref:TetR family transcriptional regulator n=1 Tax=Murinocardiopsis flavida TaxID=645275 RepID=A0A2P8CGU4_9ACTN|nr:TetR/AcrR family transcriptional regulator [Murinocardiopsis flavida]PSK84193.1 TetR family transcriptional regulator [Murinocardiopsis flavida]
MSQREDLLAGARRCLVEKGYHRTTARDIAKASGAHLASIGYHFGSKDALMNMAALEAQGEWGDVIGEVVRAAGEADTPQRLRIALDELLAALPQQRELVLTSLQAYAQLEFSDDIRAPVVAATEETRTELAALVLGRDAADIGPEDAQGLGSVVSALVVGLLVQSLVDPSSLPSGAQITDALRVLADGQDQGEAPGGQDGR